MRCRAPERNERAPTGSSGCDTRVMARLDRISPLDLRLRALAATLGPALALARAMALPLDDLVDIVEIGYFREARARGWSMRTIARKLGKSLRSITSLSQRARRGPDLLGRSEEIGRRRRAIALAGARRAIAEDALLAELGGTVAEDTLAQLFEEGVLERDERGRVRVAAACVDLVRDDAAHRLDSLRHFLDGIRAAVHGRFFVYPPRGAYARVITFSAPRGDVERIWEEVFEHLKARAIEADARAAEAAEPVQLSVTISLAEPDAPRAP